MPRVKCFMYALGFSGSMGIRSVMEVISDEARRALEKELTPRSGHSTWESFDT